ncbi:MAG: hypothetical protein QOJ15_8588, partial [Bradyrhizobium sp.]|nr:hypothetical protein [Bradyrhizobium sp.]
MRTNLRFCSLNDRLWKLQPRLMCCFEWLGG